MESKSSAAQIGIVSIGFTTVLFIILLCLISGNGASNEKLDTVITTMSILNERIEEIEKQAKITVAPEKKITFQRLP